MSDCPDGLCPVRNAIAKFGGGVQPDDNSALIRGGGVKPCCDIVIDHVRYMHASDELDKAHGVTAPAESVQQIVTRYMQPVCRVTARMLERACDHVDTTLTQLGMVPNIELRTSMTISALQHNLNELARALQAGVQAPALIAPKFEPPSDVTKHSDYAGEYARVLEQQHIIANQWLSDLIAKK